VAYSLLKDRIKTNYPKRGLLKRQIYYYFTCIHSFVNAEKRKIARKSALGVHTLRYYKSMNRLAMQ